MNVPRTAPYKYAIMVENVPPAMLGQLQKKLVSDANVFSMQV